jgi:Xaa-Pro aminopeptidase
MLNSLSTKSVESKAMKYDFAASNADYDPAKLIERLEVRLNAKRLHEAYPDCDVMILTSKDPFVSEYVALANQHRFGATGFTGSVGDALVWLKKPVVAGKTQQVSLFVDGRYHLQADQEVDQTWVEVVKMECEPQLENGWLNRLKDIKNLKIAVDPERISLSTLNALQTVAKHSHHDVVFTNGDRVLAALGLPGWKVDRPIFSISENVTGRSIPETLNALTLAMQEAALKLSNKIDPKKTLHVTCATDDAAFLLNARGYHLPNHASILAYTFLVQNQMIVYLPSCSSKCPVDLDTSRFGGYQITVIRDADALRDELKKHSVEAVFFYGNTMNALLPSLVQEIFPQAILKDDFKWVTLNRRKKTPQEMTAIRTSFLRSSRAIAKAIRFGKTESQTRSLSELELSKKIYEFYLAEGAVSLSFNTICGAGPNSAIVHYSKPSSKKTFESGEMALLDSGAYYAEGFCTDCTRGFFVGGSLHGKPSSVQAESWQKDIYTTALKAAIQVFMKPVDAKLHGTEVDALIRNQVKAAGYDYLHGTGHGVGIHVHEEGIRFSTLSTYEQSPYACVSVEPGIYVTGKGGVRIENVVFLIPEGADAYRYENLVYVGYDWDLVDVSRLTEEEKKYLKQYEATCVELGTQVTECPL